MNLICKNCETAADDHLKELKDGDCHHRPLRNAKLQGTESVVRVHQRMDGVVHDLWDANE